MILANIWLLNGKIFLDSTQDIGPSPRYSHSMCYDSDKEKVLLFGGRAIGIVADPIFFIC